MFHLGALREGPGTGYQECDSGRQDGRHSSSGLISEFSGLVTVLWGLSFLACKQGASPGPPFTAPWLPSSRGGQDPTSLRIIAGLHVGLRAQGSAMQGLA